VAKPGEGGDRGKSLPATSGLPPSTDIIRPMRLVRLAQEAKVRENRKCNIAKRQSTFCLTNADGKLPAGQITKTCPAPSTKIFRLTRRANPLYKLAPSHPRKGRIASRHERAVGGDGRDSVGRAMGSQGGISRERSDGARTNDAAAPLRRNSPGGTRLGKIFGGDGRGRRSRVVLAPVVGVKSAEAKSARPGLDKP
jgi:hypothetical protein